MVIADEMNSFVRTSPKPSWPLPLWQYIYLRMREYSFSGRDLTKVTRVETLLSADLESISKGFLRQMAEWTRDGVSLASLDEKRVTIGGASYAVATQP